MRALTTNKNTLRTKPAPCFIAKWLPAKLPTMLATAIAITKCHQTWLLSVKRTNAARLLAVFSSLALADACKKS
jgi:hypothetical protein